MIRKFEPRRALEVMKPRYGSAYRIGGRLVLTAAHLLDDVGSMCRVRSKHFSDVEFDVENVEVVYKAQQADIALIQLPDNIPPCESVVFGKLPEDKEGKKSFEMYGYPRWGRTLETGGRAVAGGRQVEGVIYLADRSPDSLLVLEPERLPSDEEIKEAKSKNPPCSPWEGYSGAAIICDGLVIAVQSRHQNSSRSGSLEASPLWKIYEDEQWRYLLKQHGINPEPAIVGGKGYNCPYVGLSPFTEKDKDYFYGRKKLTEELAKKLYDNNQKCLFIVGASGSGKTSVVQAGLLPKLKQELTFKDSEVITFSPKDNPIESHTDTLNKSRNCIIFIDQFEELYALCSQDVQKNFAESLNNLIKHYSSRSVTLIIAIRSDFYKPLQESCLKEWIPQYQVNVNPMDEEEIKSAINDPANKVGLLIESGLVDIITEDIKNINSFLPLLEFTLEKLWDKTKDEENKLTYTNYKDIGKITGAIIHHANKAFDELKNELEDELKNELENELEELTFHVFTRLIEYSLKEEIPNTRRRAFPIKKLAFKNQENSNKFEIIKKIVKKFADERLLVTDKENTVEIIHDFLISNWTQLQPYIDKQGENLRLLQKIEQDALEWVKKKKPKDGLLLQGSRLKKVEDLLKEENVTNEDEVADYVKACKDRDEEEQLENEIITSIANARRYLIENKNLDALTELIKIGERLQKLPNINGISTKKRLEFLINFGQISDKIAEKNSFQRRKDRIHAISVSPDDKIIASSSDTTIQLWSFDGNSLQILDGHQHYVVDISFSPDGTMLASASYDKTIKIWKKSTDHNCQTNWILHLTLEGHVDHVLGVSFSPDSKIIASASQDKTVRLWNKNGDPLQILRGHTNGVSNVAFSRDGKLIASASKDMTIKLWEIKSYQCKIYKLKSTSEPSETDFTKVSSVSFGSDNKTLISSNEDKKISFWDIEKNVPSVIRHKRHEARVCYATFSPDCQIIAASSEDGVITLWDKDKNFVSTLKGHRGLVTKVGFTTDSKTLVSGSYDGTIKIWDCIGKFQRHSNEIVKIDFSSNGKTIATASQDEIDIIDVQDGTYSQNVIVKLWKVTGEPLTIDDNGRVWEIKFNLTSTSQFKVDIKFDIKFNPTQGNIAVASNNEVKIYNFKLREINSFSKHQSHIHSISFNPEGTEIAIGYLDGQVILWDIDNDEHKYLDSVKYSKQVKMVAFSPQKEGQDRKIVTSGADGTVKLLYLNDNQVTSINYQGAVCYVSFSPDGGVIAIATDQNEVNALWLWYLNDGSQRILERNYHTTVRSIGFIDDGKIVAAISMDQTITLWNTADGKLLQTIEGNDNSSISVACIFSSQNDRSAIAVANSDENRINLWSLSLEELLKNSTNQICDYTKRLNLEEKAKTEEME